MHDTSLYIPLPTLNDISLIAWARMYVQQPAVKVSSLNGVCRLDTPLVPHTATLTHASVSNSKAITISSRYCACLQISMRKLLVESRIRPRFKSLVSPLNVMFLGKGLSSFMVLNHEEHL